MNETLFLPADRWEPAAQAMLDDQRQRLYRETDRIFAWLLIGQWILGIVLAVWVSPLTWQGTAVESHPHVLVAILLGGAIIGLPVALAWFRPGRALTRHVVAIGQALSAALLIHLTGGRIETHFHVFGSLAFLAFYRDWRVLITASVVVAADHFIRGMYWPQSVFGIVDGGVLRAFEHTGWIVFEDVFLILACVNGQAKMWENAKQRAQLNLAYDDIEWKVAERTVELNKKTARLAENEERMRMLVEGTDVVVWEFDWSEQRFTYVSPQAARLGHPVEDWTTPGFWQRILHPDDREEAMAFCKRETETGRDHRFQYRILSSTGEVLWIDDLVTVYRSADGSRLLRGAMIDITARKTLEEVLVKNVRELDEAKRESDQASQAKSQFLANMSHEIRTPMTAILGYADLLLEEGDIDQAPPERAEAVRTIKRNGEHLLGIINDILDLSKIEAGKLTVESVSCSPVTLLEDLAETMRLRAAAKGIAFDVEYDGPVPETIQTDPTRLRQILVNLAGNGVKFTQSGGVRIVARFVDGDNPMMEFDVIDTGIGLSSDQQERLFQPFSQADASTTRQFGGTGLGLTISRRLAQMLDGDVRVVESAPGTGSRFRVRIRADVADGVPMIDPRKGPVESAPRESLPPPPLSPPPMLEGCRILYAEDGPDNQRLISFVLRKAGADVTVVENGQLAVDAIFAAEDSGEGFDVILMDMQMPEMDGYEATRLLRARGYDKPIVALTAHAMTGDRVKCLTAGCDDYATKPIDRAKLISQVASHILSAADTVPATWLH